MASGSAPDREEIRLLLKKINDAWLKGPRQSLPQTLEECFADDLVIRGSGFKEMGRGKEACIKSYVDFVGQAVIQQCQLAEPEIDVFGDTAIATYSWDMEYLMNRKSYREMGHELFVFARGGGVWKAVWRGVLPATPAWILSKDRKENDQ